MKKLIYFHGLESQQGGPKVDLLAKSFLVYAPQIDYNNEGVWQKMKERVNLISPDIIVGSSMGGLLGFHCGYDINCKMILFNPAFERRDKYINKTNQKYIKERQKAAIKIILGEYDTEVSPQSTKEFLKDCEMKVQIEEKKIEHRIPLEVFEMEVNLIE